LEVLAYAFGVGLAWFVALVIVLLIPAAYGLFGIVVARRISRKSSWRLAGAALALFLAAPIAFWFHGYYLFKERCAIHVAPASTRELSSVRGLAFDLGYPATLARHFPGPALSWSAASRSLPAIDFYELRLDPSAFAFDLGDNVYSRCRWPRNLFTCEPASTLQSEFMVRGGREVQLSSTSQFENVLQVVRVSDDEVIAERRTPLFGGGVLGIFLGFTQGSRYLACNPSDGNIFPWLGAGRTKADYERTVDLMTRDVEFVHAAIKFRE